MRRIRTKYPDEQTSKPFIVYRIYCKSNEKSYIGITNNFKGRLSVHWNDSKKRETILCRTIRKYGRDNFIIFKIDSSDTWEGACELEKMYIKNLNTRASNGMNMTDGGDGIFGLIHSNETREKIRKGHLGKGIGPDNPMYGKPGSMLGKKWTVEQRKKLSESCKGRQPWNKDKKCPQLSGENNGFFRKIHSIETKKKIGEKSKGRKWSRETREKIAISRQGCQTGEKHSQCKLSEFDVIEIRKLYDRGGFTQSQLADNYGITQENVHCIIKRKSWTHVS